MRYPGVQVPPLPDPERFTYPDDAIVVAIRGFEYVDMTSGTSVRVVEGSKYRCDDPAVRLVPQMFALESDPDPAQAA